LPCFEMREGVMINSKSILAHCTPTPRSSPVKPRSSPVKKKSGSKDQVYKSPN
jgi:hypothetical protein